MLEIILIVVSPFVFYVAFNFGWLLGKLWNIWEKSE